MTPHRRGNSMTAQLPTLVFGAFDRHNFGDLLFPHVATALLPGRELRFAGLASRDLRPWGGHRLEGLARLATEFRGRPVNLLHAGGELLTCGAWEAAVMLLPEDEVQATIARLDSHPAERQEWARSVLGISALAPYVAGRELFPEAQLLFDAVGGMDLDARDAALRDEVLAKLRMADALSVRDQHTRTLLREAGIHAALLPDPVVLVKDLFGTRIDRHAVQGEIAAVRHAFHAGYLAVQFSADFGDDATLGLIAAQLDRIARAHGLATVFFRAGAAPWHDDLEAYRRTMERMHTPARIVTSLNIWDICALIAHSRGYLGSSLHGRIVAMAYALPRLNLHRASPGKPAAYAATWEAENLPISVPAAEIADGMAMALVADAGLLRELADTLSAHYRAGFAALRGRLA